MVFSSLKYALITPFKAFKVRYIPILLIYFTFGATTFTGIAETVWIKEELDLSAETLIMLGVWLAIPWNLKMVFGQCVDSIPLFGSNRQSYVLLAGFMMGFGSLLLAGMAGKWPWVVALGTPKTIYFMASLASVLGLILQDIVADTLCVEVVDRFENNLPKNENEITRELAKVQLLGRLAMNIGIFSVAGLGGWLAQILSYETIFLISLVIPLISMTGSFFIRVEPTEIKPIKWNVLGGGLVYAAFVVVMGLTDVQYNQEIVFGISLLLILYLLRATLNNIPSKTLWSISCVCFIIFIYRAMPSAGPGVTWWFLDVLKFDKAFLGTLSQMGSGLAILGLWLSAKWLTEKPIGSVLIWLTVIGFIVSLPTLSMIYGLHDWTQKMFGFGARTIAFIDTAAASPFVQLAMVPMLTLIAVTAPRGNVATWVSLMASLMNLALVAGALLSKTINQVWVVTREVKDAAGNILIQQNYDNLDNIFLTTIFVGLLVPLLAIFIVGKKIIPTQEQTYDR